MRVCFGKGKQKEFLDLVISNVNSPSLRGLLQFGLSTNYSQLKNFYSERRCLPGDLFNDLCTLAKIDNRLLNFKLMEAGWGQVKGGKKGKRSGRKTGY